MITPSAMEDLEKLNNLWCICMESYLQGQDIWEIGGGNETAAPAPENAEALHKWRIKVGKAILL